MLRQYRSKGELIQLGSAHEKYGVWTRAKSTNLVGFHQDSVVTVRPYQVIIGGFAERNCRQEVYHF